MFCICLQVVSPFNHSSQAIFGAGSSGSPQIIANVETNTSGSDDEVSDNLQIDIFHNTKLILNWQ